MSRHRCRRSQAAVHDPRPHLLTLPGIVPHLLLDPDEQALRGVGVDV